MLNLKQLEFIKSKLPEPNSFYKMMGCKSLVYSIKYNCDEYKALFEDTELKKKEYIFHIGIFIIDKKEYYKWIYNDEILLD